MKIRVNRSLLSIALERCAHASGSGVHAASGKVLLDVSSEDLRLFAYDSSISVEAHVPVEDRKETGVTSVGAHAKQLSSVVSALVDETITLQLGERRLLVQGTGRRKFELQTIGAEVFPESPQPDEDAPTSDVSLEALLTLTSRVSRAMAPSNADKFELQGLQLDIAHGKAEAIATDGHRLHCASAELKDVAAFSCFLPRLLVSLLPSLNPAHAVSLFAGERAVFVKQGAVLVGCSKPQTPFPPWKTSIEQLPRRQAVSCPAPVLLDAIKALLSAKSGPDTAVALQFQSGSDELHLRLDRNEGADAEDSARVDVIADEPFTTAFNPTYLLDCLRAADGRVTLSVVDQATPGADPLFFTSEGFTGWIAPVLINKADTDAAA